MIGFSAGWPHRQLLSYLVSLLLHNSLNRNRFRDKIMQQFKVLQRPLARPRMRGAAEHGRGKGIRWKAGHSTVFSLLPTDRRDTIFRPRQDVPAYVE
ncbi:hypothetical protein E5176_06425 [Ensifer adhaerens]|nr:hypothetical protein E5176_06425 [Ensifer adhaerens]